MIPVRVSLVQRPDGQFLELEGGSPKGQDDLHKLISGWAGWHRCPQLGEHNGQTASRYQARAWLAAASSLLTAIHASQVGVSWQPEAKAWLEAQTTAYQRRGHALLNKGADSAAWQTVAGGRLPMPHQVQALQALTESGGQALLTEDMGLGKTTTAILSWHASKLKRALVICPKSVKLNWVDEIQACFNQTGPIEQASSDPLIYLIDGTPSQRASVISWMTAAMEDGSQAIAIINYDLLAGLSEVSWRTLEAWVAGQACIADEFHYCKDLDSKRGKSVQALMRLAKLRLGMTGTPVRNTVDDLFAQIEILRPGTWVSYHDFANRHLITSQVQFTGNKRKTTIIRGGKNLTELARITSTLFIGRKKTDVLTLPPKIRTKPLLELEGHHLDVYNQMKRFARVELEKLMAPDGAFLKAANDSLVPGAEPRIGEAGSISMFHPLARGAVEASMRCEMIAQGFISGIPEQYAEAVAPLIAGKAERVEGFSKGSFVFPTSQKLQWLLDVVENDLKDRQVVIVSRFNAPIYWLEKRLDALKLVGAMDAVARHEALQSFKRGDKRIMCVQVKLAEGFNLTNAQDMIFLGRDWAPALNIQAEDRCYRIGTTGTVNIQVPIVQNTVEKFIEKKLNAKDADATQALSKVTLRELLEAL